MSRVAPVGGESRFWRAARDQLCMRNPNTTEIHGSVSVRKRRELEDLNSNGSFDDDIELTTSQVIGTGSLFHLHCSTRS